MTTVERICGRMVLDSRGLPTVEAEVMLSSGVLARASVASGAAPGPLEACERRDGDAAWFGRGVSRCVEFLDGEISELLRGHNADDQAEIDAALIKADGTRRKERLGANTMLAASLAVARASAMQAHEPLWRHLSADDPEVLPVPLMNVIHGGPTAPSPLDFQEFMIVPFGAESFGGALRMAAEVYHHLARLLSSRGLATAVGDEGGFCPGLRHSEATLAVLVSAIEAAGYEPGVDVGIAIDVGASALWHTDVERYVLWHEQRLLMREQMLDYIAELVASYPVISIEDGMDEEDWQGWAALSVRLGGDIQIVGDDIFVTDVERVRRGITAGVANAVLVKPNEIGTLTETLKVISVASSAGYSVVLSHRSGDTEDQAVADIAIATGCGQIKTGAPARGERVARYNHLLRVEQELGDRANYPGRSAFAR